MRHSELYNVLIMQPKEYENNTATETILQELLLGSSPPVATEVDSSFFTAVPSTFFNDFVQEEEYFHSTTPLNDFKSLVADHPRPTASSKPIRKKKKNSAHLDKVLRTLNKEQLEQVILRVCEDKPEIESIVREHVPSFDLNAAIYETQKLKKKVFQAFPNTRYGSPYDHYSFTKVKAAQAAYATAVRKPLATLSSAKQWNVLYEYILAIIEEAAELPDWESENDRKPKQALFRALASNIVKIIKEGSLSDVQCNQIQKTCETHNKSEFGTPFTETIMILDNK